MLPEAVDDNVSTQGEIEIDVLSNDNLGDEPTTIVSVTPALNGAVIINFGNTIIYELLNTDFVGIDSFTYTIEDNNGDTSTATVTVEVTLPSCEEYTNTTCNSGETFNGSCIATYSGGQSGIAFFPYVRAIDDSGNDIVYEVEMQRVGQDYLFSVFNATAICRYY